MRHRKKYIALMTLVFYSFIIFNPLIKFSVNTMGAEIIETRNKIGDYEIDCSYTGIKNGKYTWYITVLHYQEELGYDTYQYNMGPAYKSTSWEYIKQRVGPIKQGMNINTLPDYLKPKDIECNELPMLREEIISDINITESDNAALETGSFTGTLKLDTTSLYYSGQSGIYWMETHREPSDVYNETNAKIGFATHDVYRSKQFYKGTITKPVVAKTPGSLTIHYRETGKTLNLIDDALIPFNDVTNGLQIIDPMIKPYKKPSFITKEGIQYDTPIIIDPLPLLTKDKPNRDLTIYYSKSGISTDNFGTVDIEYINKDTNAVLKRDVMNNLTINSSLQITDQMIIDRGFKCDNVADTNNLLYTLDKEQPYATALPLLTPTNKHGIVKLRYTPPSNIVTYTIKYLDKSTMQPIKRIDGTTVENKQLTAVIIGNGVKTYTDADLIGLTEPIDNYVYSGVHDPKYFITLSANNKIATMNLLYELKPGVATIKVNYKDSAYVPIRDSETHTVEPGTHTYTAPSITGYTLPSPVSQSVIVTAGQQKEITFIYGPGPTPTPGPTPDPNNPPIANISAPFTEYEGNKIPVKDISTDSDGIIVARSWSHSADESDLDTGPISGYVTYNKVGEYLLGLRVWDDDFADDSTTTRVNIIQAIPIAGFNITGVLKQNRAVQVTSTSFSPSEEKYPLIIESNEWSITPTAETLAAGVTIADIKYEFTSNATVKKVLFKKPGVYQISHRVHNSKYDSIWHREVVTIEPDKPPKAFISSTDKTYRLEEEGFKAPLTMYDNSVSEDNDTIQSQVYEYRFDSNNNGSFDDEVWVQVSATGTKAKQLLSTVGKYQVRVTVTENFGQATYASLITSSDYMKATSQPKLVVVENIAPSISFDVVKRSNVKVNIATDYSSSDLTSLQTMADNFRTTLAAKGVSSSITIHDNKNLTGYSVGRYPTYTFIEYNSYWNQITRYPFGIKADGTLMGIASSITNAKSINYDQNYGTVITQDNQLFGWGKNNGWGNIPTIGTQATLTTTTKYVGGDNVLQCVHGYYTLYALKSDGKIYYHGGLKIADAATPNPILSDGDGLTLFPDPLNTNIVSIIKVDTAGQATTIVALKSDGTLIGFGINKFNELGVIPGEARVDGSGGTYYYKPSFETIAGISNVKRIFGVSNTVYAIKNDNSVWVFGAYKSGMMNYHIDKIVDYQSVVETPKALLGIDGKDIVDIKLVNKNILFSGSSILILKADGKVYGLYNGNFGTKTTSSKLIQKTSIQGYTDFYSTTESNIPLNEKIVSMSCNDYGNSYVAESGNVYRETGVRGNTSSGTITKVVIDKISAGILNTNGAILPIYGMDFDSIPLSAVANENKYFAIISKGNSVNSVLDGYGYGEYFTLGGLTKVFSNKLINNGYNVYAAVNGNNYSYKLSDSTMQDITLKQTIELSNKDNGVFLNTDLQTVFDRIISNAEATDKESDGTPLKKVKLNILSDLTANADYNLFRFASSIKNDLYKNGLDLVINFVTNKINAVTIPQSRIGTLTNIDWSNDMSNDVWTLNSDDSISRFRWEVGGNDKYIHSPEINYTVYPKFKKLVALNNRFLGLGKDGVLYGWGRNHAGNIPVKPNETHTENPTPFTVSLADLTPVSNIRDFTASNWYVMAVKNDNTLWVSGFWPTDYRSYSLNGDIHAGTQYNGFSQKYTNVLDAKANEKGYVILKTDGTVWYQGIFDNYNYVDYQQVPGISGVKKIFASTKFNFLFVDSADNVYKFQNSYNLVKINGIVGSDIVDINSFQSLADDLILKKNGDLVRLSNPAAIYKSNVVNVAYNTYQLADGKIIVDNNAAMNPNTTTSTLTTTSTTRKLGMLPDRIITALDTSKVTSDVTDNYLLCVSGSGASPDTFKFSSINSNFKNNLVANNYNISVVANNYTYKLPENSSQDITLLDLVQASKSVYKPASTSNLYTMVGLQTSFTDIKNNIIATVDKSTNKKVVELNILTDFIGIKLDSLKAKITNMIGEVSTLGYDLKVVYSTGVSGKYMDTTNANLSLTNNEKYFMYVSDGTGNNTTLPFGSYYSISNLNKEFISNLLGSGYNIAAVTPSQNWDYLDVTTGQKSSLRNMTKYSSYKYGSVQDNLYTPEQIDVALSDIINNIVVNAGTKTSYVLVNSQINYNLQFKDYETDPKYSERWKYTQDLSKFDNIEGQVYIDSGNWTVPKASLSQVGDYSIDVNANDNPSNDNFSEYRRWSSSPSTINRLIVHRAPIANFKILLAPTDATKSNFSTSIMNLSFDLDHETFDNKGIKQSYWEWKLSTEETWNIGKLPNIIVGGSSYDVRLTVTDYEGQKVSFTDTVVATIAESNETNAPTLNINPKSRPWANTDVSVTISATDASGINTIMYAWSKSSDEPLTGWATQELTPALLNTSLLVTNNKNGRWYLHAKAIDICGNTAYVCSSIYNVGTYDIDKIGPLIWVGPTNTQWLNYGNLDIEINMWDNESGYSNAEYKFVSTDGLTTLPLTTTFDQDLIVLIEPEGEWYLEIRAWDIAGNLSKERFGPYRLDRSPPILTVNPINRPWGNTDIDISISATDNLSGVDSISYALSDSITVPDDSLFFKQFESNVNAKITTEGQHYLHIKTVDKAGNIRQSYKGLYRIDKTSPDITVDVPTLQTKTGVTVNITSTDTLSGIRDLSYAWTQIRAVPTVGWTTTSFSTAAATQSVEGVWYLYIKATDNAGNVRISDYGDYTIENPLPPTITVSPINCSWTSSSVSVNVTATDNKYSIDKLYYYLSTSADTPTNDKWIDIKFMSAQLSQTLSVVIASEGIWYLHVKADNIKGAISNPVYFGTYNIDKTQPTLIDITAAAGYIHNNDVWLANSQIATFKERWVDNLSGNKTLYVNTQKSGSWYSGSYHQTSTDINSKSTTYYQQSDLSCISANRTAHSIPGQTDVIFTYKAISSGEVDYPLFVYASDYAGNESGWIDTTLKLRIDNTAPTMSLNKTNGNIVKGEVLTANITDTRSGVKEGWYMWSNSNAPINNLAAYTKLTGTNITAPLTDGTWYLHTISIDNVGNVSADIVLGNFVISTLSIKNLRVTDVKDPNWQYVFNNTDGSKKNVTFGISKLPLDKDSNSVYKNAGVKLGYAVYFKLDTVGMRDPNDHIKITPTIYYYDGINKIPVDMYYPFKGRQFTLMGSADDINPIIYNDIKIGGFKGLTLNTSVRTLNATTETWGFNYYLPATAFFVKNGNAPLPENELKKNNIIVSFRIDAYKDNLLSYQYVPNGWTAEGTQKSGFNPGDTIIFDILHRQTDDKEVRINN